MCRRLRDTAAMLSTDLGFVHQPTTQGDRDERVDDDDLAARRSLG
jgi:hypothetical protein